MRISFSDVFWYCIFGGMEIATKYDIGEYAFIIAKNKIWEVCVTDINIEIESNVGQFQTTEETIIYTVTHDIRDYDQRFHEKQLYKTREDLYRDL